MLGSILKYRYPPFQSSLFVCSITFCLYEIQYDWKVVVKDTNLSKSHHCSSHTPENFSISNPVLIFPKENNSSLVSQVEKKSACNAGDPNSIPGLGSSPGEGDVYSLLYSWLESFIGREAGQAIIHQVSKSRTQLSD